MIPQGETTLLLFVLCRPFSFCTNLPSPGYSVFSFMSPVACYSPPEPPSCLLMPSWLMHLLHVLYRLMKIWN